MTERKTEELFNDSIIVSNMLNENLERFDASSRDFNSVHKNMEHLIETIDKMILYSEEAKKEEAKKFAIEITKQVKKYQEALRDIDLDTSEIENIFNQYVQTVQKQISTIESNAYFIASTLEKNGEALIAAASKIKKSERDTVWDITLFGMGCVVGMLFLAVYPITEVTKSFYAAAAEQDAKIRKIEERYEANSETVKFLNKHNITMDYGLTDESWGKKYLQDAPFILLEKERIRIVDETNGCKRIIFRKK